MDHHAATPLDPRVLAAMLPCLAQDFGNAASRQHAFGRRAHDLAEQARAQVASLIGASPEEVIFTSGATESNNLAIKGAAERYRERGNHLVTTAIEHKSVLEACRALERRGFRVTTLPVDHEGRVSPEAVRRAVTEETILISVMHANNEVGVLEPVWEIGKIAKERGVLFHCDAAQSVGKIPMNVQDLGVDLLSFSAHKMYGPKGVGALYVRSRSPHVRLAPLIDGGGHERGLRSGTLNVPAVVGFGKACEIAAQEMGRERVRLEALRSRLLARFRAELGDVHVNGSLEHRLPHNLHVSFPFVEAELLLEEIGADVAVSSGAACMSAAAEPSYVLKAMGVGEELAHTSLRFGLGRFNTAEEVEFAAGRVIEAVRRLRERSPLAAMAGERSGMHAAGGT